MTKTTRLPRLVDQALFGAIDVAEIKRLKKLGESRESLVIEVEDNLEALVEAVQTGRDLMELYPLLADQERMESVEQIVEWAIGEVNPETYLRRALRS